MTIENFVTERELLALVGIINRTPMGDAESLWVEGLINRWNDALQKAKQPQTPTDAGEGGASGQ